MPLITVDLHCHTHHSKDSLMSPRKLLEICQRRGIDRVAITDHNTIAGAVEASKLAPERVIVGEEIMTTQGELLAYFVREPVPAGLTPEATIAILRDQNAFISVSHPFDSIRKGSWREEDLRLILPAVDALEVFNARTWLRRANQRAASLATEAKLLGTAGSDAHHPTEVGRGLLRLPDFDDAEGMRRALVAAERFGRRSPHFVHLFSRYASWRKSLGWKPRNSTGE